MGRRNGISQHNDTRRNTRHGHRADRTQTAAETHRRRVGRYDVLPLRNSGDIQARREREALVAELTTASARTLNMGNPYLSRSTAGTMLMGMIFLSMIPGAGSFPVPPTPTNNPDNSGETPSQDPLTQDPFEQPMGSAPRGGTTTEHRAGSHHHHESNTRSSDPPERHHTHTRHHPRERPRRPHQREHRPTPVTDLEVLDLRHMDILAQGEVLPEEGLGPLEHHHHHHHHNHHHHGSGDDQRLIKALQELEHAELQASIAQIEANEAEAQHTQTHTQDSNQGPHRQQRSINTPQTDTNHTIDADLKAPAHHSHPCLIVRDTGYTGNALGQRGRGQTTVSVANNCRKDATVVVTARAPCHPSQRPPPRAKNPVQKVTLNVASGEKTQTTIRRCKLSYIAGTKRQAEIKPIPRSYNTHALRQPHPHALDASYPKTEMIAFTELAGFAYSRNHTSLTGGWTAASQLATILASNAGITSEHSPASNTTMITDRSTGLVAVCASRANPTTQKQEYALIFGGTLAGVDHASSKMSKRLGNVEGVPQVLADLGVLTGRIPECYKQAKKLVQELAKKAHQDQAQGYAVGHSLGGGMAAYGAACARADGYNIQARTVSSLPANGEMREHIASLLRSDVKVERVTEGMKEVSVQGDFVSGLQDPLGSLGKLGEIFTIVPDTPLTAMDAHSNYRTHVRNHHNSHWQQEAHKSQRRRSRRSAEAAEAPSRMPRTPSVSDFLSQPETPPASSPASSPRPTMQDYLAQATTHDTPQSAATSSSRTTTSDSATAAASSQTSTPSSQPEVTVNEYGETISRTGVATGTRPKSRPKR